MKQEQNLKLKCFGMASLFSICVLSGCTEESSQISNVHIRLNAKYDSFKEQTITHRRFKHDVVTEILSDLNTPMTVKQVGKSVSDL